MVAPLPPHRVRNSHLRYLTPQINFQRISLHKILIVIILRLQHNLFYLFDSVLYRYHRLQIINETDHRRRLKVLDEVNPAHEIIVIFPIPKHLLNMGHLQLVSALN